MSTAPKLDARRAKTIAQELIVRSPAYAPGWSPAPAGPAAALLEVVARYAQSLIERLNQAPDKNKLAFLDFLGIGLLRAQAARAPLVFRTLPNVADSRAPVRTRAGATVPGRDEPLVFETDDAIALPRAQLVEIATVWPERDSWADHSDDFAAGRPFTLFKPLARIDHILYLGHDILLRFEGKTTIEIELQLKHQAAGGSGHATLRPLAVVWEYWNGTHWRTFAWAGADGAKDSTGGLVRSGVVQLSADCGRVLSTTVDGLEAYWIRARVEDPLPPDATRLFPEVDRIRLRVTTDRPVAAREAHQAFACVGGFDADAALANQAQLDLTNTFYPLGRANGRDTIFYLACEEAFSKAGARVTLCYRRVTTPEEEADALEAAMREQQAKDAIVSVAKAVAQAVLTAAGGTTAAIQKFKDTADADTPGAFEQGVPGLEARLETLQKAIADLNQQLAVLEMPKQLTALRPHIKAVGNATQSCVGAMNGLDGSWDVWDDDLEAIRVAFGAQVDSMSGALAAFDALGTLAGVVSTASRPLVLTAARAAADVVLAAATGIQGAFYYCTDPTLPDSIGAMLSPLQSAQGALSTPADIGDLKDAASTLHDNISGQVSGINDDLFDLDGTLHQAWRPAGSADSTTEEMSNDAVTVIDALLTLSHHKGAGTVGDEATALSPPRLVWEYWNGRSWQTLRPVHDDDVSNFQASGAVSFVVPDDLGSVAVYADEKRWIRARLASGVYARLRVVSWSDSVSKVSNVMPIVEPRPPALGTLRVGYHYKSAWTPAEHCFSYNDLHYEDHTNDASALGSAFRPFRPTSDSTASLYLGFDDALPADRLSFYLDIQETEGDSDGPPLEWEYWDAGSWLSLRVEDETHRFALPGMVATVWPGPPAPEPVTVSYATGNQIRLTDPRASARFRSGDRLSIAQSGLAERVTVERSADGQVTVVAPLTRDYQLATLAPAGLARFGTPRTWARARLKTPGDPRRARVRGLYPNAVWASQRETIENETLGSSTGEATQVFSLRKTPVLDGEIIEVRELEGERAFAELPALREELRARHAESDLRTVADRRTGRVNEVWVRWHTRPHLLFSGPNDRDVVLERTRGRLTFGDGRFGRIPPSGRDNVRAVSYRAGGGRVGNVKANAISQLLSGVLASGVGNPRAGEGGADAEELADVRTRGPQVLRHRYQALSRADYEALAREASPAVAVARALATTGPNGRRAPGWVKLIIVPHGREERPMPSFELKQRVQAFVAERAPAAIAGLTVTGPQYLSVGVETSIAVRDAEDAGPMRDRAIAALNTFLHPLEGGLDGRGWPFGRDVWQADVASLLEGMEGIDHVETLNLLLDGTPRGEVVRVPDDRIVVAGDVIVTLATEGA